MKLQYDEQIGHLLIGKTQTFLLFIIKLLTEKELYKYKTSFDNVLNHDEIISTLEVILNDLN